MPSSSATGQLFTTNHAIPRLSIPLPIPAKVTFQVSQEHPCTGICWVTGGALWQTGRYSVTMLQSFHQEHLAPPYYCLIRLFCLTGSSTVFTTPRQIQSIYDVPEDWLTRDLTGDGWVIYDSSYWRQAASIKFRDWGQMDGRLWNEIFTGRAKAIACCRICLSEHTDCSQIPNTHLSPVNR